MNLLTRTTLLALAKYINYLITDNISKSEFRLAECIILLKYCGEILKYRADIDTRRGSSAVFAVLDKKDEQFHTL